MVGCLIVEKSLPILIDYKPEKKIVILKFKIYQLLT